MTRTSRTTLAPAVPEQGQRRLVAPELDPDLGEDPVGLSLALVAECLQCACQRSRNWRLEDVI